MNRPFSIIVAFDSRYGIGKEGWLPWHLPADLRHFKEITTTTIDPSRQNAVIMGRRTWESLPAKFRPLPGRVNVVLSRQGRLDLPEGVLGFSSLEDALHGLSSFNIENVFVIGGDQVYANALGHPLCQKLCVTHVKGDHGCDAFFPPISKQFLLTSASEELSEGQISFHFAEYFRQ